MPIGYVLCPFGAQFELCSNDFLTKMRLARMTYATVETSLLSPISMNFVAVRNELRNLNVSPSQARNSIKRALKAVIDPPPNAAKKDAIWAFFQNRCAYCNREIDKESREGHIDHLIAEMDGGSNRLSNLVLTCGICNGDEKRDMDWLAFIAEKCGADEEARSLRVSKIKKWVTKNGETQRLSEQQLLFLQAHFDRINSVLSDAIEELRLERN